MNAGKIIGGNIKTIREQKGVKQESLAKHIGITKGRLSQIESGECEELTVHRIEKIAVYLETDFFTLTNNHSQSVHINSSTNCSGFYGTHNNIPPELMRLLMNW